MPNRLSAVLTVAAMTGFVAIGGWMFLDLMTRSENVSITASVELQNDCGIEDDVFVLLIPSTGKKLAFVNRKLTVVVKKGEALRLATSPRFPNVTYDGPSEPADSTVRITVECDSTDIENLLNRPLKDRFGG